MGSDRRRESETAAREARSELVSARAELSEMAATTQSLRTRIDELETELAQQRVGLATMDLTQVEEPLVLLDAQLREAVDAQQRLAHRVAELEARRGARASMDDEPELDPGAQIHDLSERVEVLQTQLEAARVHEGDLTFKVVHADGLVADLGERLAELGEAADRAEELRSILAGTQAEFESVAAARIEAEALVESLGHRVGELTQEVEASRSALDETSSGLDQATARIRDLDDTLAVTTLERDGARSELMRLMEEQQSQSTKIATLELEIERVSTETGMALERAMTDVERAEGDLEETRQRLQTELDAIHSRVEELEVERVSFASRSAELEEEVAAGADEVARVRAELDDALAKAAEIAQAGDEAEARTAEAEAVAVALEVEIGQVRTDLEDSSLAAEAARARAEELATEQEASARRITELEQQLVDITARVEAMAPVQAEAEQWTHEIQGRLDESRKRVESAEERANATDAELLAARQTLEEHQRALEAALASAEEATRRAAELESAMSSEPSQPVDAPAATDTKREAELEATIAELEDRLEQTEVRARRAYEAAEAAETALRFPKEGAGVSVTDPGTEQEITRLRAQVTELEEKVGQKLGQADPTELARARARIDELEMALAAGASPATQPASGSSTTDPGVGGATDVTIAELEDRLEQTEVRARRAYAAAESAEAALRFAKERGEVIVTDPAMEQEVARLRAQVAELMQKLGETEQAERRAQADATALRAGVDPDALRDPLGDEPPSPEADAPGASKLEPIQDPGGLRDRLASAALSKKGRRSSDADDWR